MRISSKNNYKRLFFKAFSMFFDGPRELEEGPGHGGGGGEGDEEGGGGEGVVEAHAGGSGGASVGGGEAKAEDGEGGGEVCGAEEEEGRRCGATNLVSRLAGPSGPAWAGTPGGTRTAQAGGRLTAEQTHLVALRSRWVGPREAVDWARSRSDLAIEAPSGGLLPGLGHVRVRCVLRDGLSLAHQVELQPERRVLPHLLHLG